jgi:chromosome segregation ATPase
MQSKDWKTKLSECARDKKQLKKRIKELTQSREEWKAKSISHKERADKIESEVRKIKDRLNDLLDTQ